ncbi:MAG: lipoyl synthase [Verrucomicrobiae bacterium]|nr:lipoyl synthase [Verrucomicrobiae bacterium]
MLTKAQSEMVKPGRKPDWFRLKLPTSPQYQQTTDLIRDLKLHTVCESARCPNRWECWSRGTATFMVAGDRCTRNCGFCSVATAKPFALEADEPMRVAEAVARLHLRHVVITMVARDDLKDGAAAHVAETVQAVREKNPGIIIEVLTSDFQGEEEDIAKVVRVKPDIFNHNLETVERLTSHVRARATYHRSLEVLKFIKTLAPGMITKSGLMLGLGESDVEIMASLQDLRRVNCDLVTLGQYLQPTPQHLPVARWVTPQEFEQWADYAKNIGFKNVASGPLVRSSYYADAVDLEVLKSI